MEEVIRVVYSFLEESYEPMGPIRLHAYCLGKEQIPAFRCYSNLRFDSFFYLGMEWVFDMTAYSIRPLELWGEESSQLRFYTKSTLGEMGESKGGGGDGLFHLREAWRFTKVAFFFIEPNSEKREKEEEKLFS